MPSFVAFLGFLIPIVAITLGFDSVNGEFNRRTMSRLLAQPVYRDALLFGKFLASLATLAVFLTALWLCVIGFGILPLISAAIIWSLVGPLVRQAPPRRAQT